MDLYWFSDHLFYNSAPQPLRDSIACIISPTAIKYFLSLAQKYSQHQNTDNCIELDPNYDQRMELDRWEFMDFKSRRSFSAIHGFSHFFRC